MTISTFQESAFTAFPRAEQRKVVRGLMEQANNTEQKAMLVSSVSALQKLFAVDARSESRVEEIVKRGDMLALLQDVPAAETPEMLLSLRGIDRFESPDIASLMEKTPRFQRLKKRYPFAIMKNGYESGAYAVLPERPVSLILYRIITLNADLYRASKDSAFLALLEGLVSEMLSQELSGKAA
jgi:hypothetical protein